MKVFAKTVLTIFAGLLYLTILTVVILPAVFMGACSLLVSEIEKNTHYLSAPQNVKIERGIMTWDAVEGAEGYSLVSGYSMIGVPSPFAEITETRIDLTVYQTESGNYRNNTCFCNTLYRFSGQCPP